MSAKVFQSRHAMGRTVRGQALVANDGFSARYDLDRIAGVFSRPTHKLAGQSYVGKILVLDTAKGGVATAWMLHEMQSRRLPQCNAGCPLRAPPVYNPSSWFHPPGGMHALGYSRQVS